MTDDRSLERAARSFIEAGRDRAHLDRAVEAALLRIEPAPARTGSPDPVEDAPIDDYSSAPCSSRRCRRALVGGGLYSSSGCPPAHLPVDRDPAPTATAVIAPTPSASSSSAAGPGPSDYTGPSGLDRLRALGRLQTAQRRPSTPTVARSGSSRPMGLASTSSHLETQSARPGPTSGRMGTRSSSTHGPRAPPRSGERNRGRPAGTA